MHEEIHSMNKKVMAAAVAVAVSAPALVYAQASTVQMYGSIRAEWSVRDEGGNRSSYNQMVNPGSSYIGFKGEEQLGGGMAAWFQCESTIDVAGVGAQLCMRNTAVGLKGGWGNFFMGNWDTPYKLSSGSSYRPFDTTGATGPAAILHNETAGNTGNTGTSFHRRQNGIVQYHTPNFNGFVGMVGYSAKNESTGLTPTAALPQSSTPNIWSLGATYNNGPIYVGAGYEKHKGTRVAAGATAAATIIPTDTGWNINAAYKFEPINFKLGAIYERLTYGSTGAGDTKRNSYGFFGDWNIQGPHTLRAHYTVAGDSSGGGGAVGRIGSSVAGATVANAGLPGVLLNANDNGAKMYAIQYAYALSKRTEVNVFYVRLDNDQGGMYRLQSGSTNNTGQDQNAYGMQLRHTF